MTGNGKRVDRPPARAESRSSSRDGRPSTTIDRPSYMMVGSAAPSASADALMATLDDSGYGGSLMGESSTGPSASGGGWRPHLEDPERHSVASHIHQLHLYVWRSASTMMELADVGSNHNRVALGRAIHRTIETLKGLQEMNAAWPAHYPSVQRPERPAPSHRPEPRPGLPHTQTTAGAYGRQGALGGSSARPQGVRRAWSMDTEDEVQAESSSAAEKKAAQEPPRLITPQVAQEFSVLKLDLKLGALPHAELVHSLEKHSIASLLDNKISQSVRHLLALRDRIEDTASKVLVTGDLNAGKSTFCNALLRRKLLPVDQQPCTSIFCEVLDARENAGLEEVHAVHKNGQYDRHDESTYDVYRLAELERIAIDSNRYMQAKVYVKDIRTMDESLLNNGVVDIALIDAPGLNMDSLKTHAVFAREEEIDVVVFVVSAANHFTLSAKEFIWNAAREKAYIFIVVNGFDMIRDKDRCQRMILEQVANLSPRTFKESAELVHFVSSNAIPVLPAPVDVGGRDGGGGGGGNGGVGSRLGGPGYGDDDDKDGDPDDDHTAGKHGEAGDRDSKGKGKQKEKMEEFENLEQSLRRFVLEKRARSKLAPAKTYLQNVLGDLNTLATVNRDVAQTELDRVTRELSELEPAFERSKRAEVQVSEDLDRTIEETCSEIYDDTRDAISTAIARVAEADVGMPYPGIWNAFQYAEDLKVAMLDQISDAVRACEEHTRERTVEGVHGITALGALHLEQHHHRLEDDDGGGNGNIDGDEPTNMDMTFRSDLMFRRRKDALARQVDAPIEMWDFVDVSSLLHRQEKVAAGTGMAMTVVGLVGSRVVGGGLGWMDGALGAARVLGRTSDLRRLIVPGIILTGKEPYLRLELRLRLDHLSPTISRQFHPPTSHLSLFFFFFFLALETNN